MSTTNSLSSLTGSLANSGTSTSSSGFGQGINVQQFVQYALANQQATITALQNEQTTLNSQTTEISKISTDINALDNAVFALSDPLGVLSSQTATSSNSSVLSATANSSATAGTHSITVNSLATTSSYYTDALASSSTTIAPGTFQIQVGSNSPVTVTVDSTNNTLSQLASTINGLNAGVSASVIQDANGYRLALVSNTSGAPGNNTVIGDINTQFNVASDGSGGGPLEADNTLRDVQSQLLGAISYSISGNSGIVNLASLGINMNNDGTLSVDNGALSTALQSNYSAVQSFLQNASTGFAQNLSTVLSNINSPGTGLLSIDSQSITNTSQDLSTQISDLQASLAVQQQNLTTVYSQVNTTLQELPMLQNQISQQLAGLP